jgi:pimeloyl-ACP methyl ester carboxylesterase
VATTFHVSSADGTRIKAWRSDQPGIPLVIANGLGTIPEAWPSLIREGSGYDTVTWYQRGTFGSERPVDPASITVEDHVEDMLAVMNSQGIDKAVVACWSIGVNIAFEFAHRHPERVAGIMAVAGVPGGTFSTMGGPLRIPRRLRKPISTRVLRSAGATGPLLTWLTPKIPVNSRTAWLLAHSGFMLPAAKPEVIIPMMKQFLRHDWGWYAKLAKAAAEHDPMDLHFVACPAATSCRWSTPNSCTRPWMTWRSCPGCKSPSGSGGDGGRRPCRPRRPPSPAAPAGATSPRPGGGHWPGPAGGLSSLPFRPGP